MLLRLGGSGSEARVSEITQSGSLTARSNSEGVWIIQTCGGPLDGDAMLVRLDLEAQGRAIVRSPGAMVAQRGNAANGNALGAGGDKPRPAIVVNKAALARGSWLTWRPEPLVCGQGSSVKVQSEVVMDGTSRLSWLEETVFGREREESGQWESSFSLRLSGPPLPDRAVYVSAAKTTPGSITADDLSGLPGTRATSVLILAASSLGDSAVGEGLIAPIIHPADRTGRIADQFSVGTSFSLATGKSQCPFGALVISAWGTSLTASRRMLNRLLGETMSGHPSFEWARQGLEPCVAALPGSG